MSTALENDELVALLMALSQTAEALARRLRPQPEAENDHDQEDAAGSDDKAQSGQHKVALDAHKAAVAAEVTRALNIESIVDRHGFRIGDGNRKGYIAAVKALEAVYDLDAGTLEPGRALDLTLHTVRAWQDLSSTAVHGEILRGLGVFYARRGFGADPTALAAALGAKYPSGPQQLLDRARLLRADKKESLFVCVAAAVVEAHNVEVWETP
ncbi:hypothetical protein PV387_23100 [Streptomyces sp. ME02-6987-2C]|uniref:hypothetical protein n=1 Tax=unclassified Streptomyces TaxID=2593676 RepID=UPI0029A0345D|nr:MULTISPECIES: hypothetical protein [unclassified Streptomyces]MDX3345978.1 hypothetical protein [Streptomyces sp. ME02-6979A]MDX3368890.1 hypothetical protein [Streptomyces sp. ME02-6987-2C]MDX3407787.1 hypothetical protein [Streptomyces sp. ME02-6977A]MDX3421744.1 hypothetical protein [Streptomyces sp. ME02-6985-2c]